MRAAGSRMRAAIGISCTCLMIGSAGCGGGDTARTSSLTHAPVATSGTTTAATVSNPRQTPTAAPPASTSRTTPSPRPSSSRATTPAKPEDRVGGTPYLAATGRGFGAFHAYVSKPQRRRDLARGSKAVRQAAVAAEYAAREVAAAGRVALNDPATRPLSQPLVGLAGNLRVLGGELKAGRVDAKDIEQASSEILAISRASLAVGEPIQEVTPALG
jgi:hypothetical protein